MNKNVYSHDYSYPEKFLQTKVNNSGTALKTADVFYFKNRLMYDWTEAQKSVKIPLFLLRILKLLIITYWSVGWK